MYNAVHDAFAPWLQVYRSLKGLSTILCTRFHSLKGLGTLTRNAVKKFFGVQPNCLFVLVFGYVCYRLSWIVSFRVHVKLFCRIVYRIIGQLMKCLCKFRVKSDAVNRFAWIIDEVNVYFYLFNEFIGQHKIINILGQPYDRIILAKWPTQDTTLRVANAVN